VSNQGAVGQIRTKPLTIVGIGCLMYVEGIFRKPEVSLGSCIEMNQHAFHSGISLIYPRVPYSCQGIVDDEQ